MGKTFRTTGWLAVVALLAAALVAPATVFAIDGHQDFPIAWDDPAYQGSDEECSSLDLAPGEVYWHFVQTQIPDSLTDPADALLSIDIAGTDDDVAGLPAYDINGKTVHWQATTPQITLDGISSNVGGDGVLNLSHICLGAEKETPTPSDEEETPTPSDEETPTPSDEETPTPSDEETPTPSDEEETPTPEGSVEELTGTPEEDVTPPSTDTLVATGSSPSNTSWQLVLVATAALLATALILTPAQRRNRK
jgi:hypothetical protein